MKIHPRKLLSIWIMSLLIVMILTAMVAQATSEPETVIEVIYIEKEPEIPEVIEEPVVEVLEPQTMSLPTTLGVYTVTAYCPCEICCGEDADGYTSDGIKATEGITVAADTNILPMGTEIFIEGVGDRVVQDVGGVIKGNKLDIFFGGSDGHQRALEFGRQQLEVFKVTN